MSKKARSSRGQKKLGKPTEETDKFAELVTETKKLLPELEKGALSSTWFRQADKVYGLAYSCDPHQQKQVAISEYEADLRAKGVDETKIGQLLLERGFVLDDREQDISAACHTIWSILLKIMEYRNRMFPTDILPKAHAMISHAVESLSQYVLHNDTSLSFWKKPWLLWLFLKRKKDDLLVQIIATVVAGLILAWLTWGFLKQPATPTSQQSTPATSRP